MKYLNVRKMYIPGQITHKNAWIQVMNDWRKITWNEYKKNKNCFIYSFLLLTKMFETLDSEGKYKLHNIFVLIQAFKLWHNQHFLNDVSLFERRLWNQCATQKKTLHLNSSIFHLNNLFLFLHSLNYNDIEWFTFL